MRRNEGQPESDLDLRRRSHCELFGWRNPKSEPRRPAERDDGSNAIRTNNHGGAVEKLLTIDEAADALGTTSRFPRRLVAERRIRSVHVGARLPVGTRAG